MQVVLVMLAGFLVRRWWTLAFAAVLPWLLALARALGLWGYGLGDSWVGVTLGLGALLLALCTIAILIGRAARGMPPTRSA